ncbi:MAG: TlpA family protein disulfide reductase [Spirochaetae bacterium HGW-Spirochaetae-1]|jgi:peroxiredoxin|nr:MAG: TlpA family protein disulfide reductase [Spirochaetae bacterium HGW-Spirochaetae-1]
MKNISKKKILSYIIELVVFMIVAAGIMHWQSRNMLSTDSPAPPFTLTTLEGESLTLESLKGKKTVLYFFAPWCTVCRFSSKNIASIRKATDPRKINVVAVALSYDSADEIRKFSRDHDLTVPILLGTEDTGRDYHVNAFPSIYILDREGRIRSHLVGYSTEAGIRLRLFFL